jgi:hypothetical protein
VSYQPSFGLLYFFVKERLTGFEIDRPLSGLHWDFSGLKKSNRKVLFSLISSAVVLHLCLSTLTSYHSIINNASTFLKKIFGSPRNLVFMRLSTFKKVPKIPIL